MNLKDYLRQNKKKHLIFDFDATLFLLKTGWNIFIDQVRKLLQETDISLFDKYKNIFWSAGMVNDLLKIKSDVIRDKVNKIYQDFESTHIKGYDINKELVSFVKENKTHKMYIWSSNTSQTIENILSENQMQNCFDSIITQDRVKYIKPEISGFNNIYKEQEGSKSDYLMIGDNPDADGKAAESAEIDFFLVDYFKK